MCNTPSVTVTDFKKAEDMQAMTVSVFTLRCLLMYWSTGNPYTPYYWRHAEYMFATTIISALPNQFLIYNVLKPTCYLI